MVQTTEIIRRLTAMHRVHPTVLVAIDGPGGAGKTTLTQLLSNGLAASGIAVEVVSFDDFFLPSNKRNLAPVSGKPIGSDFDWIRLREEVLSPLRWGHHTRYSRYDWRHDVLTESRELSAGAVVIVDGVYSSRRELASFYDLRIWVECPRELRLRRGLARDGDEARVRWEEDWMPSEDRYMREHGPKERAHVVVNGDAKLGQEGR